MFIQVALLGPGAEEDELLSNINEIVTRTNSMYGNIIYQPMVFRHQDFEFLDYLGMLRAADALVITSLREGWNLTSHEYVVCQEETKHGFILSEVYSTEFSKSVHWECECFYGCGAACQSVGYQGHG